MNGLCLSTVFCIGFGRGSTLVCFMYLFSSKEETAFEGGVAGFVG